MAFLKYRASLTPTIPTANTLVGSGLTNLDVDGNFKSLDDAKFEKSGGTLTGDVTLAATRLLIFTGATSGSVSLTVPAAAGTTTITLPTTSGTLITTGDSATVSDTMLSTSGVTGGNYGSSTAIPVISVNSKGRVTGATTATITPAWTNVTGRPTALSSFTNDSGYITSSGTAGNVTSISSAVGSAYTWTATQQFTGNGNTTTASLIGLQVYSTGGNGAVMVFNRNANYNVNMGLDSDNVIRIGGGSASSNRLQIDMSGNLTMAGNITAFSDERLKKNWRPLENDFVERLTLVKYGIFDRTDQDIVQVGVGAQSFRLLMPEAINESNDDTKTLSVNYGPAALVSSIEIAKYVLKLEERITRLEAIIDSITD
jgi:hypothetical protein